MNRSKVSLALVGERLEDLTGGLPILGLWEVKAHSCLVGLVLVVV